jgi:hypothetical protein
MRPNKQTLLAILSVCADSMNLHKGRFEIVTNDFMIFVDKKVYQLLGKTGDLELLASLIYMYV